MPPPSVRRQQQPLDSLTPFRKAVATNAFANALATPVRQCAFTAARLPHHYLLPFTTRFRSLENGKLVPYLGPADNSVQTSRAYLFNSRKLLDRLHIKRSWQRLLGHSMKFGIKDRNDYHWSDQTNHIILSQLRHTVVRTLKWIFTKPNASLLLPCDTAAKQPSSTTVLYLREDSRSGPLPSSTVTTYHLSELLGDQMLRQLVEDTAFDKNDAVLLQQSYMTLSAHTALARLSTFLDGPASFVGRSESTDESTTKLDSTEGSKKI